jgi:iron(III) transport system substrate-binding protein
MLQPVQLLAQDGWARVVEEAKKEGKLTVYNGTNFRVVRQIADLFQKEYGISVDVLDGRASEIRERIRTEQAAERKIGDLTYSGMTTLGSQMSEGTFDPHGEIPNVAKLSSFIKPNGTLLPTMVGNFAVLVNTRLIKPDAEPKSWKDLLQPQWVGKILSDDPRAAGAGEVWFEVMLDAFGREYHEKMAQQKPVFSRQFAENQRRVARGEYPIYIPFNVSETASLKGLPVKTLIPEEGIPYQPFAHAILKGAPHPNAARLFINFALDKEGQLTYAKEGFRPATDGMEASIPKDILPLTMAKLLGTTDWKRQNDMLKMAVEIYH